MIARVWHGVVPVEKAEGYSDYLSDSDRGVPDYERVPGNRGAFLLRRVDGDRVHFILLSLWDSREAIHGYAGPDIERAQYFPYDLECLIDPEPNVEHYDVMVGPIEPVAPAVRLREVTGDDLAAFYDHQADPEAKRMADVPSRDRDAFMAHWARILLDDTGTVRTIVFEGRIAGNVVAWGPPDDRLLGYWLGREFWGMGIATRAVREFLTVEKIRPLHAHVARTNVASIRVLEKCGFERDREEAGELVMRLGDGP